MLLKVWVDKLFMVCIIFKICQLGGAFPQTPPSAPGPCCPPDLLICKPLEKILWAHVIECPGSVRAILCETPLVTICHTKKSW